MDQLSENSEERLYSSELVIVSFSYSKLASKGNKLFEERLIVTRKLLILTLGASTMPIAVRLSGLVMSHGCGSQSRTFVNMRRFSHPKRPPRADIAY
jgi:hypothetical protein